jgi:choline monooxygenase
MIPFTIDERIEYASSLPAELYRDAHWFETIKEKILARTWHCIGHKSDFTHSSQPLTLLDGVLNEPLLLTKDESGKPGLISNVCTHRGMLVSTAPANSKSLRCGYHGRCFELNGCFKSMPEFDGAKDFPRQEDHLAKVDFYNWRGLYFASLDPVHPATEIFQFINERLDFLDLESALLDQESDREYQVAANWMLYCDNYLEGFHIPFVHPGLAGALDYQQYRTELFNGGSVQIGIGARDDHCFNFPKGHCYEGQNIAGFYFFLFPGTMINVYPWGISLNLIMPAAINKTVVQYRSLVWDESKREQGAGSNLHAVELEDEAVVQTVQKGIQSRIYKRGRYSPKRERGVHHFHRKLSDLIYRS